MFSMIQFQICGLIIVLIITGMHFSRQTKWIVSERIFGIFLIVVISCLVLDIASIAAIVYREYLPALLIEIIAKLYLISLLIVSLMTLVYLLADMFWRNSQFVKLCIPFFVLLGCFLCSYPFLPIYYFCDPIKKLLYSYGAAVYATYVGSLFFLVLSVIFLIAFWKKLSSSRKRPVMVILVSFIISALIQFRYNEFLLVGFAMAIATLLIYLYMENPYSRIDKNSGLHNEQAWLLYIEQMYSRGKCFHMISVYLHDMEFITDTFGSENAMVMLHYIADFFHSIEKTISFRIDAHRFIVVSSSLDYDELLSRISQRFADPFPVADVRMKLSVSYCTFPDSRLFQDAQDLVRNMDYIQAQMKRNGREAFLTVNEKLVAEQKKAANAKKRLQWALENNGFEVFYQPIYSFEKNQFISAEALIRLKDESGVFLDPEMFIPIAEENGMILEIGMTVFEKTCQFINKYQPQHLGIEFIEINLSVVQCMQETLAGDLMRIMERYEIDPSFINFEITETAMANSKDVLYSNMSQLIEQSSNFYLDDYGSGYSNLSYVIGLPLHAIKLDKSLVWAGFTSEKGNIALEFAVRMIKNLNMKIVAEGVETQAQLKRIKELGVDYVQGFYFSRPVPPKEFLETLLHQNQTLASH